MTSKDETTLRSRVSEIGIPFYIIFFILLAGLGFTIFRFLTEPYKAEITLVVGGWNLFNLIIAGCALGVVSERREARGNRRVPVDRPCEVRAENGEWIEGVIEDVSSTGISVRMRNKRLSPQHEVPGTVRFKPYSNIEHTELHVDIRNTSTSDNGVVLGCQFNLRTANDYRLMADLLYANSAQWTARLESRRVNVGIIAGTLRFLVLAFYQTARGLSYMVRFGRTPKVKSTRRGRAAA